MNMKLPTLSILMTVGLLLAAAPLGAAEPRSSNLRGVTAGVTKKAELNNNDRWGSPTRRISKPDGSEWLEYKFWVWQKVTAVVQSDMVHTIDAVPPNRLPAQKLTDRFKFGDMIKVKSRRSLPARALVGPSVNEEWQILRCADAPGVLIFAESKNGKLYARLLRFYSLSEPDDSRRKPAGRLIFADSFKATSTVAGRPMFAAKYMEYETGGGRAVISSKTRGVLPVLYPGHTLRDFTAEYEVAHPNDNCQYGLIYRSDDMAEGLAHYYMLTITPQERFRLSCWRSPRWVLQKELPIKAGALRKRQPNHVRVEVVGKRCRVHLNGKSVGEFKDGNLMKPGIIGLCLSALGDEPTSVVFHSLRVSKPRKRHQDPP